MSYYCVGSRRTNSSVVNHVGFVGLGLVVVDIIMKEWIPMFGGRQTDLCFAGRGYLKNSIAEVKFTPT